ncbi:MAG: GntR family transcriptional regulator [Candidatus Omnitrophica bacterium]|nr:GntR family transcriptional regulator [Candidatus Omnitrophota bacterium]
MAENETNSAKDAEIWFRVAPGSGVPIYRQIFDQVKLGLATDRWQVGDFMPSVREVSAALEINPMTVSKAYSLLEKSGYVEFVRGLGMRIPVAPRVEPGHASPEDAVAPLLREVVNQAQQMSLERERVIDRFNEIWKGYSHE